MYVCMCVCVCVCASIFMVLLVAVVVLNCCEMLKYLQLNATRKVLLGRCQGHMFSVNVVVLILAFWVAMTHGYLTGL